MDVNYCITNSGNINIDLNKIIVKLSIGIGRNVKEAEIALKKAKLKKNKNQKLFNYVIYQGPNLEEETNLEHKSKYDIVNSYFNLKEKLKEENNLIKDLEKFKYDPKTGLLNQVGYLIEINKLKKQNHYNNRVIFLIDGDNMHDCNSKFGYEIVDKYLTIIGKSINNSIRHQPREGQLDLADIYKPLNHRKNDSAGDEFIIDFYLDFENKKNIDCVVQRYISNIYLEQEKLSDELNIKY